MTKQEITEKFNKLCETHHQVELELEKFGKENGALFHYCEIMEAYGLLGRQPHMQDMYFRNVIKLSELKRKEDTLSDKIDSAEMKFIDLDIDLEDPYSGYHKNVHKEFMASLHRYERGPMKKEFDKAGAEQQKLSPLTDQEIGPGLFDKDGNRLPDKTDVDLSKK